MRGILLRRARGPRGCGVDGVDNCQTPVAHTIHTAYYCCYGYDCDVMLFLQCD